MEEVDERLQAGKPKEADEWRFVGLLHLIGYTDTGLFPRLNEQRAEVEACIQNYMLALAQAK
ncbi:hypothetical protein MKX42_23375 [Paenibacillus sp. FSL R7-0204]|uniref:hypothetical protein n=1 Tax=Paenibacillus sp. FSL R7-0204 TaxID=2921675 RepID=UPI0030F4BA5D